MAKLQVAVTAEDHIQGDAGAKVTLVEYGDYECPHCLIGDAVVKRLQRHFGERLRFVYRNFTRIADFVRPNALHLSAFPLATSANFRFSSTPSTSRYGSSAASSSALPFPQPTSRNA